MKGLDTLRAECYTVEAQSSADLAQAEGMMSSEIAAWRYRGGVWTWADAEWLIELTLWKTDGWSAYMGPDADGGLDAVYGEHGNSAENTMFKLIGAIKRCDHTSADALVVARDALDALPSEDAMEANAAASFLAHECHRQARERGWWDNPREVGTLLMLTVSELAEAMEAHRKGLQDQHLPHRPGIEVELADALIRICDIAGGLGLDLGGAVREKMAYNAQRHDHDPAVRANGGKAY